MSQYSVDFFNYQLEYCHHDIVEDPVLDFDALTPNTSTIEIKKTTKVPEKGFAYLDGDVVFYGIIDSVSDDEDITKVVLKPLLCLFDAKVEFNTALQNGASNYLEAAIKDRIDAYWVNNTDTLQNLPLSVTTISETGSWTLGLEGNADDNTWNLIDLLTDLIEPAMEQYAVVTDCYIDFSARQIKVIVGVVDEALKIDADDPAVEIVEFQQNRLDGDVNKLIIRQNTGAAFPNTVTYYLHPDGTYGTVNEDRIIPVIFDQKLISVSNGETLAGNAEKEAKDYFGKMKYKNYVELEVIPSSIVIGPRIMAIGTHATIFHNGQSINTILTGKKIDERITLIFGTVRMDYTKQR